MLRMCSGCTCSSSTTFQESYLSGHWPLKTDMMQFKTSITAEPCYVPISLRCALAQLHPATTGSGQISDLNYVSKELVRHAAAWLKIW